MQKIGLDMYRLLAFFALLVIGSIEASAQLRSDLVLLPTSDVKKSKTILSDTSAFVDPLLFINNEYLLPTAFFCKMELGLDKKSFMPVRIRLGSVDYVNYLEGKDKTGTIDLSGDY